MMQRSFLVAATAAMGLVLANTAAAGPIVDSRVVAFTGQDAPGINGATFQLLFPPAINAEGKIIFRAQVLGGGATAEDNEGFWLWDDGTLSLVFREGDPRLGANGNQLGDPNLNDSGRIAFTSRARSGQETVIWVQVKDDLTAPDALKAIAREGELPPGNAAEYTNFFFQGNFEQVPLTTGGESVFLADVNGFTGRALYGFDGMDTGERLFSGNDAPGGGTFQTQFAAPVIADNGRVAIQAPIIRDNQGSNIMLASERFGLRLLARSGDPAPGIPDSILGGFNAFPLSANARGGIAYEAGYIADGTPGNAIFASPGPGTPTAVLRTDLDPVSTAGLRLILMDSGAVVFTGLEDGSGDSGLYAVETGDLSPLLIAGESAPGLTGVEFDRFDQIAANRKGLIATEVRLRGANTDFTNDRGIFATSLSGDARYVVRSGDVVELPAEMVTLTDVLLNPGQQRSPGAGDGTRRAISEQGQITWVGKYAFNQSSVIMVTGIGDPPAVPPRLMGLEVTQVIQDWKNSVSLVEDRGAIVRAHFQSTPPSEFRPRLRVFSGGGQVPGSPFDAVNAGGRVPVSSNAIANRGNVTLSALFYIPKALAEGEIEVEVFDDDDSIICLDNAPPTSNDCRATVMFTEAEEIDVKFISLNWQQGARNRTVDRAATRDLADRLLSALPTENVNWTRTAAAYPFATPPVFRDVKRVLPLLRTFRTTDNCSTNAGCQTSYYGVLRSRNGTSLAGVAYLNGYAGIGFVPDSATAPGRHTHSHEIGHNLGLPHSVDGSLGLTSDGDKQGHCDSEAAAAVADYPFLELVDGRVRPTLGPMTMGDDDRVYGLDILQGRAVDPYEHFSLMSYCASSPIDFWPGKANYETLLASINNRFGANGGAKGPVTTADYRIVRGFYDVEQDALELQPLLMVLDIAEPDGQPTGEFTLTVMDDQDVVLATVPFAMAKHLGRVESPETADFLIAVPDDSAMDQIVVSRDSETLATAQRSPNAPAVEVLFPAGGEVLAEDRVTLQWTGSDADDDPLTYVVQFSTDNAATWQTLEVDFPGTSIEIVRDILPASTQGLLRVYASDGFNVTMAQSASTFSVANNMPIAGITLPETGRLYVPGQTLFLEGNANDPDEGVLTGASLTWTSDLDGDLGTGDSLAVAASSLSSGSHVITLTATDSEAAVATDTIALIINTDADPVLADAMVSWRPDGLAQVAEGQSQTIPLIVRNGGPDIATNINLSLDLEPANGNVITAVAGPAGWSCNVDGCAAAALALDTDAEVSVSVSGASPGAFEVTASVRSSEIDPASANNAEALLIETVPDPDIIFADDFED